MRDNQRIIIFPARLYRPVLDFEPRQTPVGNEVEEEARRRHFLEQPLEIGHKAKPIRHGVDFHHNPLAAAAGTVAGKHVRRTRPHIVNGEIQEDVGVGFGLLHDGLDIAHVGV